MELMCPHCHTYNHVGADGAAETARFVCAGCGAQFEAMLVEGALVPVLPRESGAPADEFFDVLSIPREPLAEPSPAPPRGLEDLFGGGPAPGADDAPPAPADAAPAPEADPFHITEAAAESAAPLDVPAPAEEAKAEPSHAAAPAVDKYAVGMRVLRISPMWLLLSSVGFFAVLMTMSWLSQPVVPVGEAVAQLPNQATSPSTTPAAVAQVEQAKAAAENSLPKTRASAEPSEETAAPPAEAASFAASAAAEASVPARGSGNYTVQVGSYNNPSEANEHVSRLRAAGFEARAVAAELPKRGTWYRVQAGRFETRDEAAKAGAQLRAKGHAAAAMVTGAN